MEVWKDITGFEGFYMVSNTGKVKSLDRWIVNSKGSLRFFKGCNIPPKLNRVGYLRCPISKEGRCYFKILSRLVAMAFIPNPENKPEVNHKDGNKLNNKASNLEWSTVSENRKHAWDLGLNKGNTRVS